jgi:hypothetical protein
VALMDGSRTHESYLWFRGKEIRGGEHHIERSRGIHTSPLIVIDERGRVDEIDNNESQRRRRVRDNDGAVWEIQETIA